MADTSLIKKANSPNEIISKEEYEHRVREIVKCKKDIVYFANTYFKILTLDQGTINIKLYPKQEEMLKFFKNEKRAVLTAPRQSGKTVSYTIFCVWQTIFFPEKKVLILANKLATALEIIERIQRAVENLPKWLCPRVAVWNKGEIVFANGSSVRGLASSSSAARGLSINCVAKGTKIVLSIDRRQQEINIDAVECLKYSATSDVRILTETGFRKFSGIRRSIANRLIRIKTSSNAFLECTEKHKIKLDSKQFVEAKDLVIGNVLSNKDTIVKIEKIEGTFEVYDALNVEGENTYLTNGIVSHNCLVFDEFAFLPKNIADLIFTSTYPVISSSKEGKMIIVSTPNGTDGNLFYDIWTKAHAKDNSSDGWKPFELHWWDVPGRDEKFKEMTIASIGQKRWDQEFACEFLSPSDFRKLIPEDILEKHKMRLDQYKLQEEAKGREMQIVAQDESKVFNFTMWECFDKKRAYLASGDVAEGTGRDSSVLYVWDVTDLSKIQLVCKFADNDTSILEFAYVADKILELYAKPPLIVENNSIGTGFLDVLRINYEYPNLVREGSSNNPWGVRSHSSVKPKACLWLRDMFTTQGFDWVIKDGDLLREIGTFVKKETTNSVGSYAAMGNAHDDLVMSLVWAAYLLQPSIVEKYFVAVEYFTSSLGVIYPKMLQPGIDYTEEELKAAYESPYYKDFQETVAEKRKQKQESEEQKKEIAKKEREIKNLERRIRETDYSKQILDPFNPMNKKEDEQQWGGGANIPGYFIGGGASEMEMGGGWTDADFDGGMWGNSWR